MKYSDIIKYNNSFKDNIKNDIYNITVISNVTIEPLKDILEYYTRVEEINSEVTIGNYNNIIQDSLTFQKSDVIIIFWELCNLLEDLHFQIEIFSEDKINNLVVNVCKEIEYFFKNIKNTSLVLFNKLTPYIFQNFNYEKNKLKYIVEIINQFIEKNKPGNVILIDLQDVFSEITPLNSIDYRYFYKTKLLYNIEFFKSYSIYITPIILAANGKNKKALIFDCDNTLWKGIIGEDGFNGIEMGSSTPYKEVQTLAMSLNNRGVILGLCSKNNYSDVEEVINKHNDFILKEENFSVKKINWKDKVTNLKDIADDLNIGLNNIVFVDDSEFEINFINQNLPEIKTFKVPENPSLYPIEFRKMIRLFFNFTKSNEDIKRIKSYSDESKRKEYKSGFNSIEDYLKSLGIKITVKRNNRESIPRISQMTQKTNQFNLTTKRYLENDIKLIFDNDNYFLYTLEAEDKFGEYGITGLCLINVEDSDAYIDTFLISCRIIGRNVEYSFFDLLVNELKKMKINKIRSDFIKTDKNIQVANFYDNLGFIHLKTENKTKKYEIFTENYKARKLDYIQIIYEG